RGEAAVVLGGSRGRRVEVGPGDVLVLPAGTGHCNAGASADLLVVGAYPDGMRWDLRRGDPAERAEVLANIARVPLPAADPVEGPRGSGRSPAAEASGAQRPAAGRPGDRREAGRRAGRLYRSAMFGSPRAFSPLAEIEHVPPRGAPPLYAWRTQLRSAICA